MNAAADSNSADAARYRFTFGHYLQKGDWSDVRSLTWTEIAALLTTHTVGQKAGTCIIPAVFAGTFAAGSGAPVNVAPTHLASTAVQHAVVQATKLAANTWVLFGNLRLA